MFGIWYVLCSILIYRLLITFDEYIRYSYRMNRYFFDCMAQTKEIQFVCVVKVICKKKGQTQPNLEGKQLKNKLRFEGPKTVGYFAVALFLAYVTKANKDPQIFSLFSCWIVILQFCKINKRKYFRDREHSIHWQLACVTYWCLQQQKKNTTCIMQITNFQVIPVCTYSQFNKKKH